MICALREAEAAEAEGLLAEPERIIAYLNGGAAEIDLDKSWHAIHYLLTGTAWGGEEPLSYLVAGGRQVGDVDVGYGPARILRPDEVRQFDAALSPITGEDVMARYDGEAMQNQQIYPEIWGEESDDLSDYVAKHFENMKSFVRRCGEAGKALIIYYC